MPNTMYDDDDDDTGDDDVVDVGGRHDAPPPGQTEGQHQRAREQPEDAPAPGPRPSLHAEWDAQGRCWVALFHGQNQSEKWRQPSKEEWEALRTRGLLVRPSMGAVAAAPTSAWSNLWETVKKNIVPVAIGGAVVFGALAVMNDGGSAASGPDDDEDEEDGDSEVEV